MCKIQPTVLAYDRVELPEDFKKAIDSYVDYFVDLQGNDSLIWVCPFDDAVDYEWSEKKLETLIDIQDAFWKYGMPDQGIRVYYWW